MRLQTDDAASSTLMIRLSFVADVNTITIYSKYCNRRNAIQNSRTSTETLKKEWTKPGQVRVRMWVCP
jgi:hypothetical protein